MLHFASHLVRRVWGPGMATVGTGGGQWGQVPSTHLSQVEEEAVASVEAGPGRVPLARSDLPLALHLVQFGFGAGAGAGAGTLKR